MKIFSTYMIMASIAMASAQRAFYSAPQSWDKGVDEKSIEKARRQSRRAKSFKRKRK
jgi:hypothetical protein